MEITQEEYNYLKIRADKWDALDTSISKCYYDEEGGECDDEGDLSVIGEIAAMAFGYL